MTHNPCERGDEQIRADRADYLTFVAQLGLTQAQIDAIVNTDDLIPMPAPFAVALDESPIHGRGLFALKAFAQGDVICPGRLGSHRTPAGRFINHSANPNATWVKRGEDLEAVALRPIEAGDEILLNYRTAVRVNFGIDLAEPSAAALVKPVQEQILAELVRLNKSIDKLLCFQLLGAQRYAERHATDPGMGRPSRHAMEGQGGLSHAPVAQDAADRGAGYPHV